MNINQISSLHHSTFLIVFLVLLTFIAHHRDFLTSTNVNQAVVQFNQSQYILGDASPQKISDGVVYTAAAAAYISGEDPTHINFEHPPLGKYLLGLSYRLTGNMLWINLIFLAVILVVFDHLMISYQLPYIIRFLTLIAFTSLPLVQAHATFVMLDFFQLAFSLIFINLIVKNSINLKTSLGLGFILGALASIKYPFPLLLLFIFLFFRYLYQHQGLKFALPTLITAGFVYLATYSAFFYSGQNLIDFIEFEKYRFNWWIGDRSMPKFTIIPFIFTGQYKSWWGTDQIITTSYWSLSWPLFFIFYLISLLKIEKSSHINTLVIYSSLLLLLYAVGGAVAERYILQLIPFWMLLVAIHVNQHLTTTSNSN